MEMGTGGGFRVDAWWPGGDIWRENSESGAKWSRGLGGEREAAAGI